MENREEAKTLGDRIVQSVASKSWTLKDLETATGIKAETWFKLIQGQGFMSPIIAKGLIDAFGSEAKTWKDLPILAGNRAKQPRIPLPDASCNLCHGTGKITYIHERRRTTAACPNCTKRAAAALENMKTASAGREDIATIRSRSPETTEVEPAGSTRLDLAIKKAEGILEPRLDALERLIKLQDAELENARSQYSNLCVELEGCHATLASISKSIREIIEKRSVLLQQIHELDGAITEQSVHQETWKTNASKTEEQLAVSSSMQKAIIDLHAQSIEKAARKVEQSRTRLDRLKARRRKKYKGLESSEDLKASEADK